MAGPIARGVRPVGLALAAMLAVGVARVASHPGTSPAGPRPRGSAAFFGSFGGVPILEPVRVPSIAVAESRLGGHLPRPGMCAANDGTVRDVYVNATGQAFIRYADLPSSPDCPAYPSGHVEVVVGRQEPEVRALSRSEVLSWLRGQADQMGAATVQTVAGVPALVIDGNFEGNCDAVTDPEQGCTPRQSNPAAVRLMLEGWYVEVYGPPAWTEAQIVGVAATLG